MLVFQRTADFQRMFEQYCPFMLSPGTVAPLFSLPDEDGRPVALADLRGSWLLLWWYPKAATPG